MALPPHSYPINSQTVCNRVGLVFRHHIFIRQETGEECDQFVILGEAAAFDPLPIVLDVSDECRYEWIANFIPVE